MVQIFQLLIIPLLERRLELQVQEVSLPQFLGLEKQLYLEHFNCKMELGLASNYSLSSGTFAINSRQLNVAGSRIYDNTTTVNGSDLAVTTGIGSEIITLSGQGSVTECKCWK